MGLSTSRPVGRRSFLAASALLVGACHRSTQATGPSSPDPPPSSLPPSEATLDASATIDRPIHALFDAYPALAKSLSRVELAPFPSAVEQASALAPDGSLWVKRDDDFTRGHESSSVSSLARLFGGGKVRKLELYFGEARALGKRRIITSGGVGSNQALAVALLGSALGFAVRLYLAPQPHSSLTTKNVAADAASGAEMRLFGSVLEAHAEATREAKESGDVYVVPPGGTTPLGTLGFVNAGMELAEDVRGKRLPSPRRIFIALGLGGSAVGLGIGCALGGLDTEIVAVRASNPQTISAATLRAIHDETIAFARARDPSFPALKHAGTHVRIDGRFVGGGYGIPTPAGDAAMARAERSGLSLDPVYTGKALAAVLDEGERSAPVLFWNTMSSRPASSSPKEKVPAAFQSFVRRS